MEYPIPGWDGYCLNDEYEVISYRRKRKVLVGVVNQANPYNKRIDIMYSLRKAGKTHHPRLHRIILAVKLGRWPEPWEHARHKDGDHTNNTFENIIVGCALLNLLDEFDIGRAKTTPNNIDEAITRLLLIKATL